MKTLPLVKLSLLRPFLTALAERGMDSDELLAQCGLTRSAVENDEASVHVMVVHTFLEHVADAAGDPAFASEIGARLDTQGWPILQKAEQTAQTVGDFLTIFCAGANELASSVSSYLEINGAKASFGERRLFKPTMPPAQNDGFMVGLSLSILQRALGDQLKPEFVTIELCAPSALSERFQCFQLIRGDEMGFRMNFPAEWLILPVRNAYAEPDLVVKASQSVAINSFLSSFRSLLQRHVGHGKLSSADVARLVSMSQSQLGRRLGRLGTDISRELAAANLAHAKHVLETTALPLGELADALGYSDPGNFSRWFKRETGLTPSAYRSLEQPTDHRPAV